MRERIRFMRRVASVTLCYFAWCTQPATAKLHTDFDLGSTGAGITLTMPLKGHNDLRLIDDVIAYRYNLTTRTNDTLNPSNANGPISAQLMFNDTFRVHHISFIFDQHVNKKGPLYVSAGVDYDNNRIEALSDPSQSSFVYNGSTIDGSLFGPIALQIHWNPIAPYLGLGLQAQPKSSSDATRRPRLDVGAIFQGPLHVDVQPSGLVAANPQLFGPYIQAFTAAVPSHVPALRIYPVLRVSMPIGR
jgi:hypothetical protein